MADNERTLRTSKPAANRAQMQGLGAGQQEMHDQQSPNRDRHATEPMRTEPFDQTLSATPGDDLGGEPTEREAGGPSQGAGDGAQPRGEVEREPRAFTTAANLDDRNAAGLDDTRGDLGASTPAGVDVHDLGQEDKPEADWGEDGGEGVTHSANHTRRGVKQEAERGQGAKTRRMNKDIVSRRR